MRFKFTAPSEKEIEEAILDYLNYQPGCFAFKVVTKAYYDPKIGAHRSLPKGVLKGTPDIIACFNGLFIGFEVKDDEGRQSKEQKEFEKGLKSKANGLYFVVRDITEVKTALARVSAASISLSKQPR